MGIIAQRVELKRGNKTIYKTKASSIDVFMVIFLLLLGLRGLQCGNDTKQYLALYNEYSSREFLQLFSDYEHEFGFKVLNKLVGLFWDNYQILLVVAAIICVLPIWYFYKRESEEQFLTISLFLTVSPFVLYFSGIRQAMAMAFVVPAWYAAKNKKLIWFIIAVLVAMQFHTSAFIMFVIYPLYYVKITKKWLWFVIPIMVAIFVFRDQVFTFLLQFLWEEYEITGKTDAITVLMLLILFGVYSYVIPDDKKMDDDTVALRNILLLSITIQSFALVHTLSMRMNYYFLLLIPILIPKIAKRSKKDFELVAKISIFVMVAYFTLYFIRMVITDNDKLNIIPYIPFWQN